MSASCYFSSLLIDLHLICHFQKLKIKFGLFGKRKAKSSDGNSDEDHSTDSDSDFEVYEVSKHDIFEAKYYIGN